METIRIVKRKRNKGSGYIWGILLALVIIGAVAWFLADRNILDRDQFSLKRDTVENDSYGEFRNSRQLQDTIGREGREEREGRAGIKAYVSFVNREVISSDSVESYTVQKGLSLLKTAVNEVDEGAGSGYPDNTVSNGGSLTSPDPEEPADPMQQAGRDSLTRSGSHSNQPFAREDLIQTGNKLVDIQVREYPSLSKIGGVLEESLNDMERADIKNSGDLKKFFIASSSLLQEMENERTMNRLSYNK